MSPPAWAPSALNWAYARHNEWSITSPIIRGHYTLICVTCQKYILLSSTTLLFPQCAFSFCSRFSSQDSPCWLQCHSCIWNTSDMNIHDNKCSLYVVYALPVISALLILLWNAFFFCFVMIVSPAADNWFLGFFVCLLLNCVGHSGRLQLSDFNSPVFYQSMQIGFSENVILLKRGGT